MTTPPNKNNNSDKKGKEYAQDINDLTEISKMLGVTKRVSSKTYGAAAILSGVGLAATAIIPKLRVLTPVFQATAVGSIGLATQNMADDKKEAREQYERLRKSIALDAVSGGLEKKAAKDLTEEDVAKLTMLSDLELGRMPKGHQAATLKMQIALEVQEGHEKNPYFAPEVTSFDKSNRMLQTVRGLQLLHEDRQMVRSLKNGPMKKDNAIADAFNRFSNMRMVSRLASKTKAGKKIVDGAKKGGKFADKLLMVSQTSSVFKDSAQIFRHKPLPRFESAQDYIDFTVARAQKGRETQQKIKDGVIKPMGMEGLFRLPYNGPKND